MAGFNVGKASRGFGMVSISVLLLGSHAFAADDIWPGIKTDAFGSRPIIEDDGVVALEAPARAEDASLVPISIKATPATGQSVRALTLIIDSNPSPVAAKFTFGPAARENGKEQHIATRVRIDSYTFVRAIAETTNSKLHMVKKFVKASGGCSAPAPKDMATVLNGMGKILIKSGVHTDASGFHEAQIMLKHPNLNGMQIDPETRAYPPAKFVKQMTIKYGGSLVLEMASGISISSDPNLRFTYKYIGQKPFAVTAIDTDNSIFTAEKELPGS